MAKFSQSFLRTYLAGFLLYTLLVVLLGAFVRATGSGAGCGSHWPLCNGEWVPASSEGKTWVEYSHRVTSGLCWFLAAGLVVVSRWCSGASVALRRWSWAVLFLMTTEALIGAGLVVFEKVAEDTSVARGFWMAAHLVNTFLLLASMMMAWCESARLDLAHTPRPGRGDMKLAAVWSIGAIALLLVGVSGAIAALGDTLFPASSLREGLEAELSASAHLFVRLRVYHPVIAIGAVAWVAGLSGFVFSSSRQRPVRGFGAAVVGLGILQLALGFLNVLLLAPVWLQLVHLALADVLWLAFIGLGHHLFFSGTAAVPVSASDRQFAVGC